MLKIETGHIDKFWDEGYLNLTYVKQDVTEEEVTEWALLGYSQDNVKSFTGSMYDSKNPMPDWIGDLKYRFGLYNQTYTFYRMDTCEVMPVHSDHFRTYSRLHNTSPEKVYRVVLMLEDWKPGHYFEMDGVGYTNWKAGDWFMWKGDVPHAAANIGVDPRYTLQITGLSMNEGQLNRLLVFFDIPGYQHPTEINHPMVERLIIPVVLNDKNRKSMAYLHNGYIKELDELTHTSDEPIHIYLYEPLCSYDTKQPSDLARNFYNEFPSDVDINNLRAYELDSIYNYAIRNNLKVIVHTGDYNANKYYPYYNSHLELVCDDLFLAVCTKVLDKNKELSTNLTKKFISLNWRHTNHRQLIASFLAEEDGYLSWYYNSDFNDATENAVFNLLEWESKHPDLYKKLKRGCELINSNAPYVVDIDANTMTVGGMWPQHVEYEEGVSPAQFNKQKNTLEKYYRDIFLDIVTETRFSQPTGNFSEKALQAIQYQKPFILVAPPYTLEYLKTYGFKTFNEFWDESYDTELDHGERLAKIFYIINTILDKSIEELREMYEKMIPIVTHNLETFKNIKWNTK